MPELPRHVEAGDEAARSAALTVFDRPVVLVAGAGSGKTAALVARVLAWSLTWGFERHLRGRETPEAARTLFSRLVAITFTDKAAAEMQVRVHEALALVAEGGVPVGLDFALLGLDGAERVRRAALLRPGLLAFRVSTIHAFCAGILRRFPLEAGVRPGFSIDATGAATDQVLSERLQAHAGRCLGPDPDPDWMHLLLEGQSLRDLSRALSVLVAERVHPELLDRDPFSEEARIALARELASRAARLGDALAEPWAELPARSRKVPHESLEELARFRDGAPSARSFEELVELAASCVRLGARRPPNSAALEALGTDAEHLVEELRDLGRRIRDLACLDPAGYQAARRALRPVLADLRAELARRGIVRFADLLHGVAELLEARPELAHRLSREFDQILVDEFQDTDPVQYRIVGALHARKGPGLFLVGDPKQSIYGWRQADIAAFEAFLSRLVDGGRGVVFHLVRNFRSVPAILEEVSEVIGPAMQEDPGVQPPFVPLLPCEAAAARARELGPGFRAVEYWKPWERSGEEAGPRTRLVRARRLEARAIAEDILRRHEQGLPWDAFAVLLRTGSEQHIYVHALRERGIPVQAAERTSFYRLREVADLSALFRVLLDPGDRLALAALLRAPWVAVSDAQLLALWEAGFPEVVEAGLPDPGPRVRERLRAIERGAPAGPEGATGLAEMLETLLADLARLRAGFRTLPARRWISDVAQAFRILPMAAARALGVRLEAEARAFLRVLGERLEAGEGRIAVLDWLREPELPGRPAEEVPILDPADRRVQVLTVHRAKGLEFEHVYLADLGRGSRGGPMDSEEVLRGAGADVGGLRLLGRDGGLLGALRDLDRRRAEAEEVRVLYVAMTRARTRLVLSGHEGRSSGPLLAMVEQRPGWTSPFPGMWSEGSFERDLPPHRRAWICEDPPASLVGEPVAAAGDDSWPAAFEQAQGRAQAARLHEARARFVAFSGLGDGVPDPGARSGSAERGSPRPRERAQRLGTALHQVLAQWSPEAEPTSEEARLSELLRRILGQDAPELREGLEILDGFLRSPVASGLRTKGRRILGREVPVLLAASGPQDPVAGFVGALDLLLEESTGGLVVADLKSDPAPPPGEIPGTYRVQVHGYVRALARALAPRRVRGEIWWLRAGRADPVPAPGD